VAELLITIETEGTAEPGQELCGLGESDLRHVITLTLAAAGIEQTVELSVLVTDDEMLRRLNRDYRGRDESTDVLSFPLLAAPLVEAPADELWGGTEAEDDHGHGETDVREGSSVVLSGEEASADEEGDESLVFALPPDMPPHLGDIVVAREMTMRQAAAAGHSAAYELAYLVAHGVLHLIGYDDHTDAGYGAMVRQQEHALAQAGIAR
jgi:probable rRNA maturation factor